jgi:3-oxoacyl-[acyl-carrier-protein] synthase-3
MLRPGGCAITGWGVALPSTLVTNADLESRLDTTDAWIVDRTGIRTRRAASGPFVVPPPIAGSLGEFGTTAALAIESGRRALAHGSVASDEIGMLILCTTTPDQQMPATSSTVAGALGISQGAMDLNAACSGFTYGLVAAAGFLLAGGGKVLLIGAETMTRVTNWDDRTNAFLFGDGAGAVLLEAVDGSGSLLSWDLGTDGSLVDLLYANHGSGMVMRGKEVFRQAVRAVCDSATAALEQAGATPGEVALFVPHQANQRIMEAVAERLAIAPERVASVIDRTGNTGAASIPIALIDAAESGRLNPGDLVLLAGFGAGMTWASAVWRWDSN